MLRALWNYFSKESSPKLQKAESIESDIVTTFQRLFLSNSIEELQDPARTCMLGMISNMASVAFSAYRTPEELLGDDERKKLGPKYMGVEEHTKDGTTIVHLNKELLTDIMEGVLKIHLDCATGVKNEDGFLWGLSDPYVIFTAGVSMARSKMIENTENPTWNSTHYLFIRKKPVLPGGSKSVSIGMYDCDKFRKTSDVQSFEQLKQESEHIGEASLTLETLKKNGVQQHEIELLLPNSKAGKPTILKFSTEFISIDSYIKEQNKTDKSHWCDENTLQNSRFSWEHLSKMTEVGFAPLYSAAYFDSDKSGTQAWLHVHRPSKTAVLAFRGTEGGEFKDVLADIDIRPAETGELVETEMVLKASNLLKEKGVIVHGGFLRVYKAVHETIMQALYSITGWTKDWAIIVTGHSLGGALAVIAAYELANRRTMDDRGPEIAMMSVGAPRLGSKIFTKYYAASVLSSFRVVNELDVVHMIPRAYLHVPQQVLVQPNGELDLDDSTLQQGFEAFNRLSREIGSRDLAMVKEQNEDTKLSFADVVSAKSHLQAYYYELVESAVLSFKQKQHK